MMVMINKQKHAIITVLVGLCGFIIVIQLVNQYQNWFGRNKDDYSRCNYEENQDPPLFIVLKTELNVNYDAGQWFHMTENYLVQHFQLQEQNLLVSSSNIIYAFNKDGFERKLNQFTKFIILLSTLTEGASPSNIEFISSSSLNHLKLTANDGILVPHAESGQICARYHATIGGEVVERNHWFQSDSNIIFIRQKIESMCRQDLKVATVFYASLEQLMTKQTLPTERKSKRQKMTIYGRDQTRTIINPAFMMDSLSDFFPPDSWEIQVITHQNDRPVCDLVYLLHDTDIFVTVHGFQSILFLFLPIPSLIFEIFPNHYYKQVYKVIANSMGLLHGYGVSKPSSYWYSLIFSQISHETCMKLSICRMIARSQNIIFERSHSIEMKKIFIRSQHLYQRFPQYSQEEESIDLVLGFKPSRREILFHSAKERFSIKET